MLMLTLLLVFAARALVNVISFELPLALLTVVVSWAAGWLIEPGKHSVDAYGEMGGIRMQRWVGAGIRGTYPEVARHAVVAR
jgi:hypothetical protein